MRSRGLGRTGRGAPDAIGAHIGSDIGDPAPFGRLAEMLARLADETGAERIDMGGGFNGPIAEWAAAVTEHIPQTERLIVEPGRSVVADAGWLLTRVVRVQARGHLIADAGMTELIRPMLYGAQHPVDLLTEGARLPDRALLDPVRPDLRSRRHPVAATRTSVRWPARVRSWRSARQVRTAPPWRRTTTGGCVPRRPSSRTGALRLSRRRETLEDVIARDLPEG